MSVLRRALYAKCPYYVVLYMQSVLIIQCLICKVSLLFSALYAKCPGVVLLSTQFTVKKFGTEKLHDSVDSVNRLIGKFPLSENAASRLSGTTPLRSRKQTCGLRTLKSFFQGS